VKNLPRAAPRPSVWNPKAEKLAPQIRFAPSCLARAADAKTAFGRFRLPSHTSVSGVLAPRFARGARFAARNLPAGFAPASESLSLPLGTRSLREIAPLFFQWLGNAKKIAFANFFPSAPPRVALRGEKSPRNPSPFKKFFAFGTHARARGSPSAEKRSGSGHLLGGATLGLGALLRGVQRSGSGHLLGGFNARARGTPPGSNARARGTPPGE